MKPDKVFLTTPGKKMKVKLNFGNSNFSGDFEMRPGGEFFWNGRGGHPRRRHGEQRTHAAQMEQLMKSQTIVFVNSIGPFGPAGNILVAQDPEFIAKIASLGSDVKYRDHSGYKAYIKEETARLTMLAEKFDVKAKKK